MAPEVMLRKKYSTKADIYSLGAVFYRLLENHYPVAQSEFVFQSEISPVTQNILRKMLN